MRGFFNSSWKILRRLGASPKSEIASPSANAQSETDIAATKTDTSKLLKAGFLGGDSGKSKLSPSDRRATLLANVSTELRTPLTLILAPLESLLMGNHGSLTQDQSACCAPFTTILSDCCKWFLGCSIFQMRNLARFRLVGSRLTSQF